MSTRLWQETVLNLIATASPIDMPPSFSDGTRVKDFPLMMLPSIVTVKIPFCPFKPIRYRNSGMGKEKPASLKFRGQPDNGCTNRQLKQKQIFPAHKPDTSLP